MRCEVVKGKEEEEVEGWKGGRVERIDKARWRLGADQ